MTLEHHRFLAREFPELKDRIHELKQNSEAFRALYEQYEALDNEILRIEQDIETPSDEYTESLKQRRVALKDQIYDLLTGRLRPEADTEEYVIRHKFRTPINQGEVARAWSERGYSCDDFVDPPGREWKDFTHRTNELVTVTEGQLEVDMHGATHRLEPGDELFIPKGASHTVRNTHTEETRWLYGYD
jgi:uncharacterized protein YdcH (DUF465 family)